MTPFLRNINIVNTFSDEFILKENFSPGLSIQERKLIYLCNVLANHIEALEKERAEFYQEISELRRLSTIRNCESNMRSSMEQDRYRRSSRESIPSSSYYGSPGQTEDRENRNHNAYSYGVKNGHSYSAAEYQNSFGKNPYK